MFPITVLKRLKRQKRQLAGCGCPTQRFSSRHPELNSGSDPNWEDFTSPCLLKADTPDTHVTLAVEFL